MEFFSGAKAENSLNMSIYLTAQIIIKTLCKLMFKLKKPKYYNLFNTFICSFSGGKIGKAKPTILPSERIHHQPEVPDCPSLFQQWYNFIFKNSSRNATNKHLDQICINKVIKMLAHPNAQNNI